MPLFEFIKKEFEALDVPSNSDPQFTLEGWLWEHFGDDKNDGYRPCYCREYAESRIERPHTLDPDTLYHYIDEACRRIDAFVDDVE